ncbi:MAG: chromosome segregation protein SMC, partial [Lentilitoribacter sp.]
AILKIETLGQTRQSLNSAFSKLKRETSAVESDRDRKRQTLLQHLDITELVPAQILAVINTKRRLLGLNELPEINANTSLAQGLAEPSSGQQFNKPAALIELGKLTDMIGGLSEMGSSVPVLIGLIEKLEADPQLMNTLKLRALIEQGLPLIDGPECPLCDHQWPDEGHLIAHLHSKQERSKAAAVIKQEIQEKANLLSIEVNVLKDQLVEVYRLAKIEKQTEFMAGVEIWGKDLNSFLENLKDIERILLQKDRLSIGWHALPDNFCVALENFVAHVNAMPDQTDKITAQTFLMNAAERFKDYIRVRNSATKAQNIRDLSELAYHAWCEAMEGELESLYEMVEADFSKFYRILNDGDEEKFVAKLQASEGKLDFDVNFYERGLFPPGAFHSEGHQDGMGVCLYLALMKRLLGDSFTIALLDDVVMSVDAGHRYQFCKLLMSEFPNTQFIIATHDRLWAEQMRSAGLVTRKSSISFHSWSVETGPLVEANLDVWTEIEAALEKGNVETAAHSLRRHLEFVSRLLADQLGARPVFKADGNYDLGDLMPSSMARLKELLGKAIKCSQSWENKPMMQLALDRKDRLKAANTAKGEEDWAINKAVHHNEWANFSKNDFEPVVQTFKELIACAQCDDCKSWLYITPKNTAPEVLKCSCSLTNFNLKMKKT